MVMLLLVIMAYLFGSLSSAVIMAHCMGLPDPRTEGSKNPGTTNMLRLGGKKAAILTLIGDVLKGVIPILAAKLCTISSIGMGLVALAVFLGHLYPVFFGFHGGKGVATALGCLTALAWPAGLCMLLTWIITALVSRYSSLAALVTALLAPLYMWYFSNWPFTLTVIVISSLLFYRHKQNIRKLIQGNENKI